MSTFNDQLGTDGLDPLAFTASHDFDWNLLALLLGEPVEEPDDLVGVVADMTALFVWMIGERPATEADGSAYLEDIGARAIASAVVFQGGALAADTFLAPERLAGLLAELAELGFPIIPEITPQSIDL